MAARFVESVVAATVGSNALRRAIGSVDRLGEREIRTTAAIAASFQDRPVVALERELADEMPLARNSRELRKVAERLAAAHDAAERGDAPLGPALAAADRRIRALVADLDAARELLDIDNGRIGQQERALWTEIEAIREYAAVAARIDEGLEQRIAVLAETDAARARTLRDEVLYVVRRRRRDILLQLAVATQGYAALRRIEQGNLELIWMIRSMSTTTVSAMRTAALAARLLEAGGPSATTALAEMGDAWGDVVRAVDLVDQRREEALAEMLEAG